MAQQLNWIEHLTTAQEVVGSTPTWVTEEKKMSKVEKKKRRIEERIAELERIVRVALTKKSSTSLEINVGEYQRKISDAKRELANL